MSDECTVSVVMPAYNEEEYIREAIKSVLRQTYHNFEFIIIDDCSTDSTAKLVNEFNDRRINFIQNDRNYCLPISLNRGIKHASGKYIARMDADDRSLPKRFEKQVKVLNECSDVHVVSSWKQLIDANGRRVGVQEIKNDIDWTPQYLQAEGPTIAHPSVMMRKSTLQDLGGYRKEFTYAQDLDLWIRMARQHSSGFVYVIQEPLFELRLTPGRYKKKPIQQKFADYAGMRNMQNVDFNQILDTSCRSKRSRYYTYHYAIGKILINEGYRRQAIFHFIRALRYKPSVLGGWYRLLSALIPWR
jgi:glycosyltransferase involved in cell wall biosynthesis